MACFFFTECALFAEFPALHFFTGVVARFFKASTCGFSRLSRLQRSGRFGVEGLGFRVEGSKVPVVGFRVAGL